MKNKGITLVSLVVTIIVLIILAGVSLNLILGNNGIITMAKKVKENMELAQVEEETTLNELYNQMENGGGISEEIDYSAIVKLNEFKKAIADYIEEAGGSKLDFTADTITFGESIKGILAEATKDATALESDILAGKTAWVKGNKITGTMKDNGALNGNLNCSQSYTIPKGYTSGGKIVANSLESQTQATALAGDIASGKTAWINGKKVEGTGISVFEKGSFITGIIEPGAYKHITITLQRYYELSENARLVPYGTDLISGQLAPHIPYSIFVNGNTVDVSIWNGLGSESGNRKIYYVVLGLNGI